LANTTVSRLADVDAQAVGLAEPLQGIKQGLQLGGLGSQEDHVIGKKQEAQEGGAKEAHAGLRRVLGQPGLNPVEEQVEEQGESGSPWRTPQVQANSAPSASPCLGRARTPQCMLQRVSSMGPVTPAPASRAMSLSRGTLS